MRQKARNEEVVCGLHMAIKSSDEFVVAVQVRSRIRTTKVYLSDIDEVVRRGELSGRLGVHVTGNGEMGGKKETMVGVWKQERQEKGELNLGDTKVTSQQTLHKLWKKQFLIHIQTEPSNAAGFSSHPVLKH